MKKFTRTLSFRRKHAPKTTSSEDQRSSYWEEDSYKVKHGQIVFPVKYLGSLEVTKSRGTDICHEAAMAMMKNHKRKKTSLVININGVRVTDENTKVSSRSNNITFFTVYVNNDYFLSANDAVANQLLLDQTVEKISFCTPDPKDDRLFSYICRDGTSMKWLCHSFLTDKASGERISNALGSAFSESYLRKEDLRKKEVANEVCSVSLLLFDFIFIFFKTMCRIYIYIYMIN
ncbi:Numb-like protein [Trichoplax sp. H2]|nr:Numb-like protein [Trichoplax sp. H2]|eukprot:RDD42190.1 Numb-like protein [Trichoplax sp. H2]